MRKQKRKDSTKNEAFAKRWACSRRTIADWRKAGAPLEDEAAMVDWLTPRKHLPEGTRKLIHGDPTWSEFGESTEEPGAAAALRRLEEAERSAHRDYRTSLKEGMPYKTKLAQERWTKLAESLRRYDALVAANRRDSGELMPRSEVERVLANLAWYLRIAGQQVAVAITKPVMQLKSPAEVNRLIDRGLWEQLLAAYSAIAANSKGEMRVPEWATEALCSDLDHVLDGASENMKARSEWLAKLAAGSAKELAKA